jgi:hypothetical protein
MHQEWIFANQIWPFPAKQRAALIQAELPCIDPTRSAFTVWEKTNPEELFCGFLHALHGKRP